MNLSLSGAYRYFIHSKSTDMRKGFNGLSGIVQNDFQKDPMSGDVFIFLNKPRNRIKLLHWQGDGFVIYYKCLEKGTFEIPKSDTAGSSLSITHQQLQFILDGIVLSSIKKRVRYEPHFVNKISMESMRSAHV
jgi:transposase